MRVESLVFGCIGVTLVRAGPVPYRRVDLLPKRQLSATGVGSSISPSISAAPTGQVGLVPAVGNIPANTSPLNIVPIQLSTSILGGGLLSSRSAIASATPGLARSNGTSIATSAGSIPSGNVIGIVPAVPNDPGKSPPLSTFAPVDPLLLSSLSVGLARTNALVGNGTAVAAPAAASLTGTSTAILAGAVTTSAVGVTETTFPLVGQDPPKPAAASLISQSVSTIIPSTTITASTFSSIPPVPAAQAESDDGAVLVTTTLMVTRTHTTSTPSRASQPAQAAAPGAAGRQSRHHHHGDRSGAAQASIQTAPVSQTSSPLLVVPNIETMPLVAASTITVAAGQGSGLAIVPITPGNVNINAVTVTVTVAEKTQTVVVISTTTVASR